MANDSQKTPLINITTEKTDLRKKEPPLVDIKVSNPVTYLKSWWKKILGNEGIDLRFRIKPLTAIAISIIVITVSMGIGRFVLPFNIPFFEYAAPTPLPTPASTPQNGGGWRETAFSGELRFTSTEQRYYLQTASSEAILLEVPKTIDIKKLVSKRIFATGLFHDQKRLLLVKEATDLEILPEVSKPVPTITPIPSSEPSPIPQTSSDNPAEEDGFL